MGEAGGDGAALVRAVRQAVDDAEADLGRMPFFVRPMAKRGFAGRTGRSHADWRALLDEVAAAGTAAAARARHPALAGDLDRLAESFRTAPERARKAMGGNAEAMRQVEERSAAREAAVRALAAWLAA